MGGSACRNMRNGGFYWVRSVHGTQLELSGAYIVIVNTKIEVNDSMKLSGEALTGNLLARN